MRSLEQLQALWRKDKAFFDQAVLDWYQQDEFPVWRFNSRGKVGDVYIYHFNGKDHYFRLKRDKYSYFPKPRAGASKAANSNGDWEYLGTYSPPPPNLSVPAIYDLTNYQDFRDYSKHAYACCYGSTDELVLYS